MPNTDKLQPDSSHEPDSSNQQNSNALSRELDELQSGIRVDFDQKLSELSGLLQRFKALIISPNVQAANDPTVAPNIQATQISATSKSQTDNSPKSSIRITKVQTTEKTDAQSTSVIKADISEVPAATPPILTVRATESARFETGLYKLNSQLYRFRLELDQELEFREEPLHVHFNQESELSIMLQKISDHSSEKNSNK